MTRILSLYKAPGLPIKLPICAICLDRTRGKAHVRQLGFGVRIWLCALHHSVEFMRSNAGLDFAVTLARIWDAQGCLTRSRTKALDAHLASMTEVAKTERRARPGSYAWPRLRYEAERAFAVGESVLATITALRERHGQDHATVPSIRTMRRWFSQGRWLRPAIVAGALGSR
jgi:hypothetical protein